MYTVETSIFENYVTDSIARLPEPYKSKINNLAFFVEDEPSQDQRERLGLRPCQSLFGLYEGIPLPARNGHEANMLPDRITIFKNTHEQFAIDEAGIKHQIANTVWHEVAHYFGLGHDRIHELESKL